MPTDNMDRRAMVGRSLLAMLVLSSGCGDGSGNTEGSATPPSLASTPAIKAAMELGSAQTLEKSRKTKKAIEAYRHVIEKYPESSQAEIARDKLKSLELK